VEASSGKPLRAQQRTILVAQERVFAAALGNLSLRQAEQGDGAEADPAHLQQVGGEGWRRSDRRARV
jgi:hypothetical protein